MHRDEQGLRKNERVDQNTMITKQAVGFRVLQGDPKEVKRYTRDFFRVSSRVNRRFLRITRSESVLYRPQRSNLGDDVALNLVRLCCERGATTWRRAGVRKVRSRIGVTAKRSPFTYSQFQLPPTVCTYGNIHKKIAA